MSPRRADASVGVAIVDAAAEIVAQDGPDGLSTRALADSVGSSPMAVYTHFGSIGAIRLAVAREGLARVRHRMDALGESRDPVADLTAMCLCLAAFARAEPHLYRLAFGQSADAPARDTVQATLEPLRVAVSRALAAGRLRPPGTDVARLLFAAVHGVLVSPVPPADDAALVRLLRALIVGFGDQPARANRSMRRGRVRSAGLLIPPAA